MKVLRKMQAGKRLFVLFLGILFCGVAGGQGRTFNEGYDDYGPYHYRTQAEWKQIREEVFGRYGLEDSLRLSTLGRVLPNVICPWWLEDLYRPEVIRGRLKRFGYVGYVLDPLTGLPELTNSWDKTVLTDSVWRDVPVDLVVYCRGTDAFDVFLRSDSSWMNFIRKVFDPATGMINKFHNGCRPAGLHFYLPDFSFREKRRFMRFVRSVSMVIDHFCIEGERLYKGEKCRLTFTFAPEAREELDFLSGVMDLSDEVNIAVYDEYGLPVSPVLRYTVTNDPASLLSRVFNQFYLFSFRMPDDVVETGCCSDLHKLARAEYSEHNWRMYLLLDIVLLAGLTALMWLYFLYSPFYMLVERNRFLVFPVLITLMTEMVIVFFYMTEALSPQLLFFDLNEGTHLYLLALPLVFIGGYLILRMSGKKERLP